VFTTSGTYPWSRYVIQMSYYVCVCGLSSFQNIQAKNRHVKISSVHVKSICQKHSFSKGVVLYDDLYRLDGVPIDKAT